MDGAGLEWGGEVGSCWVVSCLRDRTCPLLVYSFFLVLFDFVRGERVGDKSLDVPALRGGR